VAFQYYSESDDRFKITTPVDTKFMRICDNGHAYHYRMQKDFAQMGILKGYWKCKSCGKIKGKEEAKGIFLPETCECLNDGDKRRGTSLFEYEEIFLKSSSKYNFKGNCDGIVVINDEEYIIDFKTMNTNMFSFLSKPDPKYLTQVMIYMWLAKVKKSIIFYEDKNLQLVKELPVDYDPGLVEVIKKNAVMLKDMLENKKIPKINKKYSKDKAPCKWCDYLHKCYAKR
jgi:hypothetical protein